MNATYFVGLDLGSKHDFTALAVVEEAGGEEVGLRLRHVERIPLGTGYVAIVERVKVVTEALEKQGSVHLVVDATGLGAVVVELVGRARMGCRLWAVSITAGKREGCSQGIYRVPKKDLVAGLQVLLEQGAIQMAAGLGERAALVKELADMRVKVTRAGREQYEAGKYGEHDDLVLALSLACWGVRKRRRSTLPADRCTIPPAGV